MCDWALTDRKTTKSVLILSALAAGRTGHINTTGVHAYILQPNILKEPKGHFDLWDRSVTLIIIS